MILWLLTAVGIATTIFAIYVLRKTEHTLPSLGFKKHPIKFKIFSLAYFITFIISIIVYYNRSNSYVRPFSYFILLSLMVVFVFFEIIYMPTERKYCFIILIQVLIIALSFNFTQAFMYHTVLGRDPWDHQYLTETIIKKGKVPQYLPDLVTGKNNPYTKMPGMHLLITFTSYIGISSYIVNSIISVGTTTIILSTLTAYLIGNKLYNYKVGLLAALLVTISDSVLNLTGKTIIPNTMGIGIAFLILYIFIFKIHKNISANLIVIFLLVFSLATIHSLSYAFVIIEIIILLFATFAALIKIRISVSTKKINLIITLASNIPTKKIKLLFYCLTPITMIAILYWKFIDSVYWEKLLFIIDQGISVLFGGAGGDGAHIPILQILWARIGLILYAILALFGLTWLIIYEKNKNDKKVMFASFALFILFYGVVTLLIPSQSRVSHRIWAYSEIVNSITIAITIFLVMGLIKKNLGRKLVSGVLVFSIAFLMFTSPLSNNDNPLTKQYPAYRTGLYDSEISGGKFIVIQKECMDQSRYIFDDNWHHIVGTYSSNSRNIKIYLDGIETNNLTLSGLANYNMSVANSNFLIGRFSLTGRDSNYYFKGSIDYIRIYNRSLSNREVYENYQGNVSIDGLVSWWKFDEKFGENARDSMGRNNGVIYGATWINDDNNTFLLFDGIDDYVDCGNGTSLAISDEITVEARVRTTAQDEHRIIVSKWERGGKGYVLESYRPWAQRGEFVIFVDNSRQNLRIAKATLYVVDYDYACALMYLMNFSQIEVPRNFDEVIHCDDCTTIIRTEAITNLYFLMGPRWKQVSMYLTEKQAKKIFAKVSMSGNIIYNNGNVMCLQ